MNMNLPHGADDEFLARVRESAHAAVPASTLNLDSVLRSSRRKHTTRRASITLASTLALATVGAGAAGALPGIPGLWGNTPVEVAPTDAGPTAEGEVLVDPPSSSPTAIPAPDPKTDLAYLVPGVRTVAKPTTYRVDENTVVLDLGLEAGGGDRYLAVVTLAKIDGRHSATELEVLAGGDTALQNLRAGNLGGTLLWRGVTSDAMVLPSNGGPALVFGLSSGATEGSQYLVFDDPQTEGAADAQGASASPGTDADAGAGADKKPGAPEAGSSLPVTPFDVLGDGSVWMRVLQVDRATAEPRGFIYANEGTWSASWCGTASPECAVIHDVARKTVDTPKAAAPAPIVAKLAPMLVKDAEANEVPAMETCVAQRTGTSWTAPPQLTGKGFWRAPKGVDADVWRLCLIDMSEALQLAQTGEAPSGGDVSPSPASSEEPTQAPENEDPLGLGELLEGLFGG